jgi:hypothetical protein
LNAEARAKAGNYLSAIPLKQLERKDLYGKLLQTLAKSTVAKL